MKFPTINNHFFKHCILTILSIGMLAWMLAAGNITDDFPYSHCVQSPEIFDSNYPRAAEAFWGCEGDKISSLKDVINSIPNHYILVNGRLANFFALTSSIVNPFIIDCLHAVVFSLLIYLMLKLISLRTTNFLSPIFLSIFAWAVWIILPWEDGIASSCFFFNYVWSSTFNLAFIYLILSLHYPQTRNRIIVTTALALIAGAMHEGFSLPISGLLIAIIAYDYYKSRKISPSLCVPIVAYWLSTIVVSASPAVWSLLDDRNNFDYLPTFFSYFIGVRLWPLWLSIILLSVNCLRNKKIDRISFILAAIAILSVAVAIIARQSARALWLTYLLALIISFRSLPISWLSHSARPLTTAIAFVATLALAVWLYSLSAWQYRFSQQTDDIFSSLNVTLTNIAYANTSTTGTMPWWLWEIPQYPDDASETARANIAAEQFRNYHTRFVILPKKFENTPFDSLPSVNGTAKLKGIYPTYYSNNRLDTTLLNLQFGNPRHILPSGNVNPIYGLARFITKFKEESPMLLTVPRYLEEIPVVVTEKMKNQGICYADTAWFYRVIYIGRSLYGLSIHRIDL